MTTRFTLSKTGKRIDKAVQTLDSCFPQWYEGQAIDTLIVNDVAVSTLWLIAGVYGLEMVQTGSVVTFTKK